MAKARALDKRRRSIANIRKITKTMELVSTAQFRRAMERAVAAGDYAERLARLVADLSNSGLEGASPLLAKRESKKRAILLVLTANRGMCGGYNSGVLRTATARLDELRAEYGEVELDVSGKRGISFLKYRSYEIARGFERFDHKPTYDQVLEIADDYLDRYATGEVDRIDVAYCKFGSLSKQFPVAETLLPFSETRDDSKGVSERSRTEYEFLPSPESVLEEVVPNAFRVNMFKRFLDAAVGEQIARMTAMKAATDNADSMISTLTATYNRARQSQITNEIIEVVSGASALK
ncbi:MAG: ATP synthase F1 subunit gamma [Thermoguttaceae bacterium]|nr:ATP synthase F1 subunit gamma [Thermoguttaceae bacterium]